MGSLIMSNNRAHLSNQIFHYTRCNTLKRVTRRRGPSLRHLRPGDTDTFEQMSQRLRVVGNTTFE